MYCHRWRHIEQNLRQTNGGNTASPTPQTGKREAKKKGRVRVTSSFRGSHAKQGRDKASKELFHISGNCIRNESSKKRQTATKKRNAHHVAIYLGGGGWWPVARTAPMCGHPTRRFGQANPSSPHELGRSVRASAWRTLVLSSSCRRVPPSRDDIDKLAQCF